MVDVCVHMFVCMYVYVCLCKRVCACTKQTHHFKTLMVDFC